MNNFYKENINKIVEGIQQIETNFLKRLEKLIIATNLKKKKLIICGNGGSAATASHIAVDLTKNARIKTVNFNEYDLSREVKDRTKNLLMFLKIILSYILEY